MTAALPAAAAVRSFRVAVINAFAAGAEANMIVFGCVIVQFGPVNVAWVKARDVKKAAAVRKRARGRSSRCRMKNRSS
jgi:hypothetical protein